MFLMTKQPFSVLLLVACLLGTAAPAPAGIKLSKSDHICYLGNSLAERMQHDGWLEAYIQASMPELELVFRNHGFVGDKVLDRPRNSGFMDPHSYLELSKADVIFAFFGYNESFDNKPDQFKSDLAKWIDETRSKNYSGKGSPRIVLFSPIAHENLNSPDLPTGKENNVRLMAYTAAMKAVAQEKNVTFVDLFHPSQKLYARRTAPLTLNGIHLTTEGNRQIAREIYRALFGTVAPTDNSEIERIRDAVIDKNWHWFNRYRATDGNDVWGGRSKLHNNRETLQRELEQLDVMTANRDKRIWAVARGGDLKVDDSNVPPAIKVETNFKDPNLKKQGGVNKTSSLTFISGEEGVSKMKLAKGVKANLFASEEMFPELVNPVQMAVDTKGRLWVAAWKTYPKWEPTKEMDDRLLILPDENRDGVADKAITFAKVHNPTGFEFWNGGVLVASAPDILFLKDTDGDDVADIRIRVLHGLDSADTHHTANNFVYGPDGHIYYQRGVFHVSNVETPWQANQKSGTSGMYRFNPRTFQFSFHAPNSPNPHGTSFDYWGYHYATDGTGGRAYQVKPNGKGGFTMRNLLKKTVRPVPSSFVLSSSHFPPEYDGNFLICNAIAFLGIKQYKLEYNTETGDVNGVEVEDMLVSSDPNFRPTDTEVGDDGALYVSDWCNPIIGHMQHNIRDPSRDHDHGRIYRLTYPDRPLMEHIDIDGQPIDVLLERLKHPVNIIRYRARIELSEHPSSEVIKATRVWMKQFDPKKKEDAHHLMEALWLHQQHNVKNMDLLQTMLESPEPHARIAAGTVKQFWTMDPTQMVVGSDDPSQNEIPEVNIPGAIVIKTLPEMMKYDKTEFTVRPGADVTLVFQNEDFMPHNLIIGLPGSASEIGPMAEALGGEGFKLHFKPASDKILVASKMINFGEHEVLKFKAPVTPGRYDFLCTFPGHWRLMRGQMLVVAEGQTLPPAENVPVARDWNIKDLEPMLAHLEHGRSFEKGKATYTNLGCAQCHKIGKEGGNVGPELTEVFKKLKGNRRDLLEHILEPSLAIEDKYKAYEVETLEDRLFGLITERTDTHLMIVTNPQNPVPQKVNLKDVESIRPLKTSLMPRGILSMLDEKQILDLLAFIEAGGDPKHKLYQH